MPLHGSPGDRNNIGHRNPDCFYRRRQEVGQEDSELLRPLQVSPQEVEGTKDGCGSSLPNFARAAIPTYWPGTVQPMVVKKIGGNKSTWIVPSRSGGSWSCDWTRSWSSCMWLRGTPVPSSRWPLNSSPQITGSPSSSWSTLTGEKTWSALQVDWRGCLTTRPSGCYVQVGPSSAMAGACRGA